MSEHKDTMPECCKTGQKFSENVKRTRKELKEYYYNETLSGQENVLKC